MKKILQIVGVLILIIILFRGFIYRLVIQYSEIGTRTEIRITNRELLELIDRKSTNKKIGLKEIVNIADEITNEKLKFTTKRASSNPNDLMNKRKANCVGYSTMFNSIANHLIRKNELQNDIKAQHKIGHLSLLGINLHQFFESSFFADHDFNELRDNKTNEVIFIDPTISDYLWIKRITKLQ